jgi:death-on-curing protein
VDGNKRICIFIMLTFLAVNGLHISCTNDDIIAIGLGVADGSMSYEALLEWVRAHTEEQQ